MTSMLVHVVGAPVELRARTYLSGWGDGSAHQIIVSKTVIGKTKRPQLKTRKLDNDIKSLDGVMNL